MFLLSSQMAFPSHTSRSQTTVKQPHCVSSHLSITTTISLKTHLPLTKPTSKSVVSKLIFGSSWMKRSIIIYQVSDNRGVGPCILAMRMAFRNLKELPKNFKFIADGYSAYLLAAQQFFTNSVKNSSLSPPR